MISPNFIIVAILANLVGSFNYVFNTFKGRTKPNRVTWVIWTLAPMIAFAAQVDKGVGIQSITTFMAGFWPLLVLAASFANKKPIWKLGSFDYICGGLSILGLILWVLSGEGNLAIIFSIIADGLAATPTLVKSYSHPE